MPFGTAAAVSFAIANALVAPAAVSWEVENPDRPAPAVEFEVSRAHVESWESPSLAFRPRIRVAGVFVEDLELVAGPEIEDAPIDQHNAEWHFTVRGRGWAIGQTERVFSKDAVVELFFDHGVPGAVIEPTEPDYIGCVVGCDQKSRFEPTVRINCRDASARYDKYETCEEFEPFTGLDRLGITRAMCEAAGIVNVIGPSGDRYDKPIQATNKKLFDVLRALWEPKGGRVRMLDFDTLEVSIPRLKVAPQPPDHVWTAGSWEGSLSAIPPENCPSRWVIHGSSAVIVDETGVETEVNVQEAEAIYAPKVGISQQLVDGSIVATGLDPFDPEPRVISRVVTQTARRGGKVLWQDQLEYGFKNPRHARLVTAPSAAGSAGGGYNYVPSYIDEDGAFVTWPFEKFVLLGQRSTRNTYVAPGTLESASTERRAWYLRTMGVRNVDSTPTTTSVVNAYVYDDDQSYSTLTEQYDKDEEIRLAYTYFTSGTQIGAQKAEVQEQYGYRAIRSRVGSPPDATLYERFDGKGQTEIVENWRLIERRTTQDDLTDDKLVGGKRITRETWNDRRRPSGAYDWGDFKSNLDREVFGFFGRDITQFEIRSEQQVEQIEYPAEGGRIPTLFMGVLPITRYTASVWTELRLQPVELVIDDETARRWFGFERETIAHEFVQSIAEAQELIDLRRTRLLGPKYDVNRPDHSAQVGETVLLVDPAAGVSERFLITRCHRSRGQRMPRATYRLEKWRAA